MREPAQPRGRRRAAGRADRGRSSSAAARAAGGFAGRAAAILRLLQGIVDAVTAEGPGPARPGAAQHRHGGRTAVAGHDDLAALARNDRRRTTGECGRRLVGAVVSRMSDGTIAGFVARNALAEDTPLAPERRSIGSPRPSSRSCQHRSAGAPARAGARRSGRVAARRTAGLRGGLGPSRPEDDDLVLRQAVRVGRVRARADERTDAGGRGRADERRPAGAREAPGSRRWPRTSSARSTWRSCSICFASRRTTSAGPS